LKCSAHRPATAIPCAANELKERIARQSKVEPEELECRVTTFHALGRGIIQEVDGREISVKALRTKCRYRGRDRQT
jgi:hypothetical protein